jgi:hypothetical protein
MELINVLQYYYKHDAPMGRESKSLFLQRFSNLSLSMTTNVKKAPAYKTQTLIELIIKKKKGLFS